MMITFSCTSLFSSGLYKVMKEPGTDIELGQGQLKYCIFQCIQMCLTGMVKTLITKFYQDQFKEQGMFCRIEDYGENGSCFPMSKAV